MDEIYKQHNSQPAFERNERSRNIDDKEGGEKNSWIRRDNPEVFQKFIG